MDEKIKVVVTIRADFERHHWWHPGLGEWLLSLMAEPTYQMFVELPGGTGGVAASANLAVAAFMEKHPDAEWYVQMDNDTAPPLDIMRILDDLPPYVDIVTPVIFMMRDERTYPMQGLYVGEDRHFEPISLKDNEPGLYEVDQAGGGCTFIRRRVLAAMKRPYFKVLYDEETQMMSISDDVYFQMNARELGFRLFCDTRFIASHFHTTDLSFNRIYQDARPA